MVAVRAIDEADDACCLADDADMLYNKFNVEGRFPPDRPLQHPNTLHGCAVAAGAHWKVSRCDDRHLVVCQSVNDTLSGTAAAYSYCRFLIQSS